MGSSRGKRWAAVVRVFGGSVWNGGRCAGIRVVAPVMCQSIMRNVAKVEMCGTVIVGCAVVVLDWKRGSLTVGHVLRL